MLSLLELGCSGKDRNSASRWRAMLGSNFKAYLTFRTVWLAKKPCKFAIQWPWLLKERTIGIDGISKNWQPINGSPNSDFRKMGCSLRLEPRAQSLLLLIRRWSFAFIDWCWYFLYRTLFLRDDCWPFNDKADPSDGWSSRVVQQVKWPSSRDWYGKLSMYIRHKLEKFLSRLESHCINFDLYCMDARELPSHIKADHTHE